MATSDSTIEYDQYLQVWTLDEGSALSFFGLSEDDYEVVVLQDAPRTEREREKHRPEAKLFGVRRRAAASLATPAGVGS
jgi:hypothetical protein